MQMSIGALEFMSFLRGFWDVIPAEISSLIWFGVKLLGLYGVFAYFRDA